MKRVERNLRKMLLGLEKMGRVEKENRDESIWRLSGYIRFEFGRDVFKEYSESVWTVDENLKKREFKD